MIVYSPLMLYTCILGNEWVQEKWNQVEGAVWYCSNYNLAFYGRMIYRDD